MAGKERLIACVLVIISTFSPASSVQNLERGGRFSRSSSSVSGSGWSDLRPAAVSKPWILIRYPGHMVGSARTGNGVVKTSITNDADNELRSQTSALYEELKHEKHSSSSATGGTYFTKLKTRKHRRSYDFLNTSSQLIKRAGNLWESLITVVGNNRIRRHSHEAAESNTTDLNEAAHQNLDSYTELHNTTETSDIFTAADSTASKTTVGKNLDTAETSNILTAADSTASETTVGENLDTTEKVVSLVWEETTLTTRSYDVLEVGRFSGVTTDLSFGASEKIKTQDTLILNETGEKSGLSQNVSSEAASDNTGNNDTDSSALDYNGNVSTVVLQSIPDITPSATPIALPDTSDIMTTLQVKEFITTTQASTEKVSVIIQSDNTTTFSTESSSRFDTESSSRFDTESSSRFDTESSTRFDTESSSRFDTESSTRFDTESSSRFDTGKPHIKTVDSETGPQTVKYDMVSHSEADRDSFDGNANISSTSQSHMETTHVSRTAGGQDEITSTTTELMTDFKVSPTSNGSSGKDVSTAPYARFNIASSTPLFEPDNRYASPNSSTLDVFPDKNNVLVTESDIERDNLEEMYSYFPFPGARPEWEMVERTCHYAWEIHVYAFGSLFGIVGLYAVLSFVRLWWISRLFTGGYFVSVHVLLMMICSTRSFYLLYDGYGSSRILHVGLNYFLYSVTFPCLTSAFSLLFYSVLKATQARLISASLQKLQILIFIITVHFMILTAAAVLIGFNMKASVVLFVSQAYFITWSLFLFSGYAFIFRKLLSVAVDRQKDIYISPSTTLSAKVKSILTLSAAVKVMLFIAICVLLVTGMEIYSIVGIYNIFTRGRQEPWTLWVFHTVLRFLELILCLLQSYVVSLPLRYHLCRDKHTCGVVCAPCSIILCCAHKIDNSECAPDVNNFREKSTYNYISKVDKDGLIDSSSKLLNNHNTDTIPIIDIQATAGSRPNSLLIIEDGYVRFQTDYDINKIVDSCNDLSQGPADVHSMNTFLLRDGFANTGFSLSPGEDKEESVVQVETDLADKSRKSSMTSSDFFRVPSSVSLADSLENELEKAFESFKVDTSIEEDKHNGCTSIETTTNNGEPRVSSVLSTPSLKCKENETSSRQSKDTDTPNSLCSDLHLSSLQRTARPSEDSKTSKYRERSLNPNVPRKPKGISKDTVSFNVRQDSVSTGDPNMSKHEKQLLKSEDGDYEMDVGIFTSPRRPSEGQGNQAAVLTSLLKPYDSDSSESIDV